MTTIAREVTKLIYSCLKVRVQMKIGTSSQSENKVNLPVSATTADADESKYLKANLLYFLSSFTDITATLSNFFLPM